jgi:hypothetical protein
MVAFSALLVALKFTKPPRLSMRAVPALPSPLKLIVAKPLLEMVALPAVLPVLKSIVALVKLRMLALPALALVKPSAPLL